MFDSIAIGRRIAEARKARGLNSPAALAKALQARIDARDYKKQDGGKKPKKALLARQTVANWEAGAVVPPWDKVALMAEVFGPDHDEEWIMFGERRAAQLKQDGYMLTRISPEEMALLQSFREANKDGQASIIRSAQALAGAHPSLELTPHPFRRREDRINE